MKPLNTRKNRTQQTLSIVRAPGVLVSRTTRGTSVRPMVGARDKSSSYTVPRWG